MNEQQPAHLKSGDDADRAEWVPVTFDSFEHVNGPFFHGTKTDFAPGDELVPGHGSNYHEGRVANHVYFAALLSTFITTCVRRVASPRTTNPRGTSSSS